MQFEINSSINLIPKADWDYLNGSHFPFTRYAFLSALEASGAISAQTGWQAHHLLIFSGLKLISVSALSIILN